VPCVAKDQLQAEKATLVSQVTHTVLDRDLVVLVKTDHL
jgi:hypothetical protein